MNEQQQINDKAKEILATIHINDSEDILAALRIAIISGMRMEIADQMVRLDSSKYLSADVLRDEKKLEDARDIAIEMKERRMEP